MYLSPLTWHSLVTWIIWNWDSRRTASGDRRPTCDLNLNAEIEMCHCYCDTVSITSSPWTVVIISALSLSEPVPTWRTATWIMKYKGKSVTCWADSVQFNKKRTFFALETLFMQVGENSVSCCFEQRGPCSHRVLWQWSFQLSCASHRTHLAEVRVGCQWGIVLLSHVKWTERPGETHCLQVNRCRWLSVYLRWCNGGDPQGCYPADNLSTNTIKYNKHLF